LRAVGPMRFDSPIRCGARQHGRAAGEGVEKRERAMCGHWNDYLCTIEDHVALILVNLALADVAPMEGLRRLVTVRIPMRTRTADGLTSDAEAETLDALESALTESLAPHVHLTDPDSPDADAPEIHAILVGRVICNGMRDLYFYATDGRDWDERIAQLLEPFPGYELDIILADDPGWEAYLSFLFPSPRDLQGIFNREQCEQLEELGDPLTQARTIEHWISLPSERARDSAITEVTRLGYEVRGVTVEESEDEEFDCVTRGGESGQDAHRDADAAGGVHTFFRVHLAHIDVPRIDRIEAITAPLFDLAERLGGEYDGWQTSVESGAAEGGPAEAREGS
jgi:regulator of RNase E activity RraB